MNYFKCIYCGRFISYKDMDEGKTGLDYTFDTEYSCEDSLYYHKLCKEKDESRTKVTC